MATRQIRKVHVDEYNTALRGVCGSFDIEPTEGSHFLNGCFDVHSTGGLDFTFVEQDSDFIVRNSENIRRDPGDNFFLVIQQGGHSRMCQDETINTLSPGDIYLADSTKPSTFHYDGRLSRQISINLPRDEMKHRFGNRMEGGVYIEKDNPLGLAMRSIAKGLLDDSLPQHRCLAESLLSVLGSYLINRAENRQAKPEPHQLAYFQAHQLISENFMNPEYSVADIASTLGISLRQLQRAFRITGETPHQCLQDTRLNSAVEILRKPAPVSGSSIASVAYACGFADISTFYRRYKARFGCSPTQERERTTSRHLQ